MELQKKLSLLIIEDELLIQKSFTMIFQQLGLEPIGASSGKEAIELILNNDFDIIITDLMLSDISGFDILESSLKKYDRQEISKKFIIISAYQSEKIDKKIAEYNCSFHRKPFKNISLMAKNIIKEFYNGKN
jgi:DNA-binding NtrC family response regulator